MAQYLDSTAADFSARLDRLLADRDRTLGDVDSGVTATLGDVKARGDAALIDLTRRFDRFDLTPETIRVGEAEVDGAMARLPHQLEADLRLAAERIAAYHRRQVPDGFDYTDEAGVRLGQRWTPLDAVGLYCPGGKAAYPSSVLMNAVPAKVAGVPRIAMVSPAPDGVLNPVVIAAAKIAGVTEMYRIGGAQAVAALAYGTESVSAVHKIVGPGNAYVTAAKRQVFGTVGIDTIAGPSEVLIVADGENDPRWLAADLLAQAEHDEAAQSILVTDHPAFAKIVGEAVEDVLAELPPGSPALRSWTDHGALITVPSLSEAAPVIDRIAPEHLELAVADPDALLPLFRHAGAVFLGRHTPEAVGDYIAGPNHVLPTSGAAHFASGLSTLEFMKRTSLIGCSADALQAIGPAAARLADAEGLPAHALSIRKRLPHG